MWEGGDETLLMPVLLYSSKIMIWREKEKLGLELLNIRRMNRVLNVPIR